jgi:hypothetical protein
MEMPRADEWAKGVDGPEAKVGNDGELGDLKPGMGFAIGYGVTLGEVFRFDANIANIRTEHTATFTGDQYNRDVMLTTHLVPVRLGGTFLAPGFLDGRVKPEMGVGFVAFITKYYTNQEISFFGTTMDGQAWTRDVCYGPEVKLGAEIQIVGPLAVEGYLTYWTAEATLGNWVQTGDAPLRGPAREDFTGWAIWIAPRFYL